MGKLFFGPQRIEKKCMNYKRVEKKEKIFPTTQTWNPEHHIQNAIFLLCIWVVAHKTENKT